MGRSKPVVPPDFWLSRGVDLGTEWFKAHVQPHVEARPVQTLISFTAQKLDAIKGAGQTVVWVTRAVVQITVRDEVTNAPLVGFKNFVTSPLKGVPLLNGALQFATDYVGGPTLTTEQCVGRILVAGAVATVITAGAVALLPEEVLGGAVALGGAFVLNVAADLFMKPFIFDRLGLSASKEDQQASEP